MPSVTSEIDMAAARKSIQVALEQTPGPARQRATAPTREQVDYASPRQVYEWVADGHVKAGHEPSGLALPWHIIETLGLPDPPQFVVVGEERYSDGRWFLLFAVSEAEVTTRRPPCEECSGTGGKHLKVDYTDEKSGRVRQVRCPNAPAIRR